MKIVKNEFVCCSTVVSPDNSFEIYVDQDMVNSGSLLEDMT